jgi:hypothetical protein
MVTFIRMKSYVGFFHGKKFDMVTALTDTRR